MAQFWKIEESTGAGYIVLDGIYETEAGAQQAINKMPSNQNMRAVLYRAGNLVGERGAQRVDANEARATRAAITASLLTKGI